MEALRLVKGGQVASVAAEILGIPKATLENWVKLNTKGQLHLFRVRTGKTAQRRMRRSSITMIAMTSRI